MREKKRKHRENILNGILLKVCCVCRICHSEGDEECPLIMPCRCTGSLRFVHHACLHQWIKSSDTRCCELCKYNFIMETHLKPLRKVSFSTHKYNTLSRLYTNTPMGSSLNHATKSCTSSSPACIHTNNVIMETCLRNV